MIATVKGSTGSAHRRYNPLRDDWVLVSPGRARRPWAGALEPDTVPPRPAYDPTCYLCPGNERAGGAVNPRYDSTFVFTNDFSALTPDAATDSWTDGLLTAEGVAGTCRVVCFSPRHDLSLTGMTASAVRTVIDTWADQTAELGAAHAWVQVFENRGAGMGASNPHPHGQIWAGTALPVEAERERRTQRDYLERNGRSLLVDYAAQERGGERVVVDNGEWLAVVPFWAVWPFETLLLPTFPAARLNELDSSARDVLARTMLDLLAAYDNLFEVPFPYSMGWHQAPFEPPAAGGHVTAGAGTETARGWQLHAHYYPPLLRSASVRKFMVGYELLAEPQRDVTPEDAAARLRAVRPRS